MQCGARSNGNDIAWRNEIRKAYTADDSTKIREEGIHGRSSGSGCSTICLRGEDAVSVCGVNFANRFFEGVYDKNCNKDIKDVGVFCVANNVHDGFDQNVNLDGKMQVLYTKIIPGQTNEEDPLLLGGLVGTDSLRDAHRGMKTLFDTSSQITSAVLGCLLVSFLMIVVITGSRIILLGRMCPTHNSV